MKAKSPDIYILYNGDRCGEGDEDGTECPFLNMEWRVCDEFGDSLEYSDETMNHWNRCDHCKEWTAIEEKHKWATPLTLSVGLRAARCNRCRALFDPGQLCETKTMCPVCNWNGKGAEYGGKA